MGSRLRADPERILECCLEITAQMLTPIQPSIKYIFPPDYEDQEALKHIPGFCYPCISNSEAVQNYTFVLTDIQGQYRFGYCRYSPNVKTCLCIVSYLPWFETFYILLNTISELKKKKEEGDVVGPLLERLLKLSPPTPGCSIVVKPEGSSKEYKFKTPDTSKLPCIPENHNLTDYYAHIEPSNMILLFVCMFFERRIIVTSKKLSVLTACTYGAMSLLYPMHWQHMFVPIVPPHLLDYCCAPMPFLAGVHSSLMPIVRKMPLDDVVILDADTNEVECPFNDIATLPSGVISTLKSTLKKIDLPIDDRVARAFLSAMVSLVGGYRDALRFKPGEQIIFDKDVFITQSKSPDKRAFLQLTLHLQLFEQFVSERLELLNAGKGFNDLFEEQIGMQAEDQKKLKHQYKQWMKQSNAFVGKAMKSAHKGLHGTKQNLKVAGKEAKKNLNQMKANINEMLKGKDDEEIGGEIKKSNSLPYMKHYGIGARISPIIRRRALSPQPQARKAHSFHQDGDHRTRPQRPPPPRKSVRDRTNAISLVIDGDVHGRKLLTRHSTPNLSTEPPIATLVSLDEDQPSNEPKNRDSLLGLAEALSDDTINHGATSEGTNQQNSTTSQTEKSPKPEQKSPKPDQKSPKTEQKSPKPDRPPRRSSLGRNRPAVPPRPSIKKKTSSSSVTSTGSPQNSPVTPSECLLTPLKPVPIDLQQDIMNSLGPDCQVFFPEWKSRISEINSEISSSTSVSSSTAGTSKTVSTNAEHSPTNAEHSTTNAEHSPTLIGGHATDTTTSRGATKISESSPTLNDELSNSLELKDRQKNALKENGSSNETKVSLLDTDTSSSEDFKFNSASSQPSQWVNFD